MTYEELLQEVERSSEEEIRKIRERTEAEIRALLEDAERKARDIRERHIKDAEKLAESERMERLFRAHSDVSARIAEVRHEIFDSAFCAARERLSDIREKPQYPEIFQALFNEALSFFSSGELVVHVDPGDTEICRKMITETGRPCNIVSDIRCTGGLILEAESGRIRVDNTIDSRLDRARERLKTEIFSALFGD
ncbi:MAG: V-type ATP synthase subunit E [Methanoculleaceae archaeon]